jgi:hypothetical protein
MGDIVKSTLPRGSKARNKGSFDHLTGNGYDVRTGGQDMPDRTPEVRASSEALARKINLLLDTAATEGRDIQFKDIEAAMQEAGSPLSRARWGYMKTGTGPHTTDEDLLRNLAVFFGVNAEYLLDGDGTLPGRVEAQLELLTVMRTNNVKNFAARQLADIAPETLNEISAIISAHLSSHTAAATEAAPGQQ